MTRAPLTGAGVYKDPGGKVRERGREALHLFRGCRAQPGAAAQQGGPRQKVRVARRRRLTPCLPVLPLATAALGRRRQQAGLPGGGLRDDGAEGQGRPEPLVHTPPSNARRAPEGQDPLRDPPQEDPGAWGHGAALHSPARHQVDWGVRGCAPASGSCGSCHVVQGAEDQREPGLSRREHVLRSPHQSKPSFPCCRAKQNTPRNDARPAAARSEHTQLSHHDALRGGRRERPWRGQQAREQEGPGEEHGEGTHCSWELL